MSGWCQELILYGSANLRGLDFVGVSLIKICYYYNGCYKVFCRVISWNTNCRRLAKRPRVYSFAFKQDQGSSNKFSLLRRGFMTDQNLDGHLQSSVLEK